MPAKSKAQQRFFGMVRAAQKGEGASSPEVAKVADEISDKDAKKFAKTKHKGLPEKKAVKEALSTKDAKKLNKASALSHSDNPKDQDRARARQTEVDYKDLLRQMKAKKKEVKEEDNYSTRDKELKKTSKPRSQRYKALHSPTDKSGNVDVNEGVMDIVRKYNKKKEAKKPQKAQDAGARARRVLQRKEYKSKVSSIVPAELEDHKTWNDFRKHI